MKTYPYAIFDMDGTLLDSMKVWKNLGRNYLELIGIRPPEDLEEHLATMSMLEGAEYFHRELGGFYNKRTYSIFFDREISFTVKHDQAFIFGKSFRV